MRWLPARSNFLRSRRSRRRYGWSWGLELSGGIVLSHGAAAHCQSLKFPGACLTNGRRFQFHDSRNYAGLSSERSVAPEIFEPVRRQLGVAHRVLDVLVAEVGLHRPRVCALVGELVAAGMAQHVRVHPMTSARRPWRRAAACGRSPRSRTARPLRRKTNGDGGSCSRLSRRRARNSTPGEGMGSGRCRSWPGDVQVGAWRSDLHPLQVTSSDARRPCRKAIRIMVLSRWPWRLPLAASISFRPRPRSDARASAVRFGRRSRRLPLRLDLFTQNDDVAFIGRHRWAEGNRPVASAAGRGAERHRRIELAGLDRGIGHVPVAGLIAELDRRRDADRVGGPCRYGRV